MHKVTCTVSISLIYHKPAASCEKDSRELTNCQIMQNELRVLTQMLVACLPRSTCIPASVTRYHCCHPLHFQQMLHAVGMSCHFEDACCTIYTVLHQLPYKVDTELINQCQYRRLHTGTLLSRADSEFIVTDSFMNCTQFLVAWSGASSLPMLNMSRSTPTQNLA